jgi:hypothetical protein
MFYPDDEEGIEAQQQEEGVMPEGASVEPGPTIRLMIKKINYSRAITLDLSMLTEAELDALEKLFKLAFDEARPSCRLRDQEAQRSYAEGDDSNNRNYRPVPQFVVRERPSRKHKESIRDGSEGLSDRDGPDLSGGGIRGTSDAVADDEPGSSQPQDDGSEIDLDSSLRPMGPNTDT